MAAYVLWAQRYEKFVERQLQDLRHQSRVAYQGEVAGPVLYGVGLAQDTLADIAVYRYPTNARRGASLGYAGSIAGIAGNAAGLSLTNYNLLAELLHRRNLRKKNSLPRQLMEDRLRVLNQLDRMVP